MYIDGIDTRTLYATAAVVGPESASVSPPSAVAAANGPASGEPGRLHQLMAGAPPANDAERAMLRRMEDVLRGSVEAVQKLVAEGARQARLGRDIHGRSLTSRVEDHPWEQRVLELVNVERARHGLAPLSYSAQLDRASEAHNLQQVATRTMAHQGIGDGDPGSRVRATGFDRSWGENVATGQLSPEQVVAEWMASPGHRRNILDPEFRQLAVSYATATDGRSYWAQTFGG